MKYSADGRNYQEEFVADVVIPSAQILTSNTSPVLLVKAPPPGKMIIVQQVLLNFRPGASAYTTNLQPLLLLGAIAILNFVTQWSAPVATIEPDTPANNFQTASSVDGQGLFLSTQTGNPLAGNGYARVRVYYTIEDTD